MTDILIIAPTRAEQGPLQSVVAELPESASFFKNPGEGLLEPHQSHANCMLDFTGLYKQLRPKLVLLLGDRYETHAAALAAHFLRIPIGHIHGGETTTGAFDDALRHGITHMAKLHFVATASALDRVHELISHRGYDEDHPDVHLVGAPGLDLIPQNSAKRDQKVIVVSYYPETNLPDGGHRQLRQMLKHLDFYTNDHAIFFSRVNSDPGHELIAGEIEEFISTFPESASWISPNTREQYLHLCEHAQFAIGNSSSLVIECPWLGLPSILIGDRQAGRSLAASVFLAGYDIEEALGEALRFIGDPASIYRGGASEKIAAVVRNFANG